MSTHQTWFTIGGVPICMVTPSPLRVEPSFEGYLSPPPDDMDKAVVCTFTPWEELPMPEPGSKLVLSNGMHDIFWSPTGVRQYFTIPYVVPPPEHRERPHLWQELPEEPGRRMHLHFRPNCVDYFSTASGCFNAAKIERLIIGGDRLILHASFLQWQDKAIAFTANSGVGKSTQADLWHKYAGAEILNGDRMVFGLRDGVMTGFGLPVAGSSNIFVNRTVPLRCIVLLEQAPENVIRRESARLALPLLLRQVTVNGWSPWFMDRACTILSDLLERVPVYRLGATPDERAVRCLMEQLEQDGV